MIPARVMSKPKLKTFFDADCEAICVDGIPGNYQLEYFFDNFDDMRRCNCKVYPPQMQSFYLACMLWYWQVDVTHSFSHKHETVRYNLVTMALVCGSEALVSQFESWAKRDFAWAFIMAWINSLVKDDNFDAQHKFLQLWWDTGIDLMQFSRSQMGLMKKTLAKLKT